MILFVFGFVIMLTLTFTKFEVLCTKDKTREQSSLFSVLWCTPNYIASHCIIRS